jgi:hypothetical protein
MKQTLNQFIKRPRQAVASAMVFLGLVATTTAQAQLEDGLVSYWPLDEVVGTKTPDLVSGYDMELSNLTAADLVEGRWGMAFQFNNANQTMLRRVNASGELLPINQHPAFTVSFWAKVKGTGLSDLRMFSEGSTTDNGPLFNIGTHSGGTTDQVDLFIRHAPWPTVDHIRSETEALDDTWRHIAFIQQEDGSRALYIDGQLDPLEIAPKPEGDWRVNTTTIGGILRASPGFWLTGLMDDVALWSRALTEQEVQQVATEGLVSVFPPLTLGMVAYWPLDEVIGIKTPDLASGYDMELANLTTDDLVEGRWGNAMRFENARQTMLRRINAPGEELPINQHDAFTVSFWAKVKGTGLSDLRMFSEGSTTDNGPLFNIGTHSGGTTDQVDLFIRNAPWPTVDHIRSEGLALDDTWRHIAFVQQQDGSRGLYIDGQLDPLEIAPKPEGDWVLNTTTIGGILRASPGFWLTGLLDDVALWKRALDPSEIQDLTENGTPTPFSKTLPLAVRSFTSDLPAVAAGDKAILRWDVTRNVQVSISGGVGDVTAITDAGLGSIEVNLDTSRTFILTLLRGEETVSESLTVAAIDQVANGWTLLDNFDRYPEGNLGDSGVWFDLTSTGVAVVNHEGNHVAAPNNASVVALLPLRTLTIQEGESRTLFFRVITTGVFGDPVRGVATLTDRNLRFGGDLNGGDLGTHVLIGDEWFVGDLIGANNGPEAQANYALDPTLEKGAVYNIWMDVANGPFDAGDPPANTGDTFTIHVQRDGGGARQTILSNQISDRDPVGDVLLGFTRTMLDKLAIGGRTGHSTEHTLLFDDFYLSQSGFLTTVPRPYGFTEPIPGDVDIILSISMEENQIQIIWEGGTLESASQIDGTWTPVGGATSPHSVDPTGNELFFRVSQ